MKPLKQHINEGLKNAKPVPQSLPWSFDAFPYEWEDFKAKIWRVNPKAKFVKYTEEGIDFEALLDKTGKSTEIKWDIENMKIYTSVPKALFFQTLQGGKNKATEVLTHVNV